MKFPSIEVYSDQRILSAKVYEKIDGANVSLRKDEANQLVPWSRGGPIGNKQGYYFDDFRREFYGSSLHSNLMDLPSELILFGEFTHNGDGHINYKNNTNKFFPFGFYNLEETRFLKPNENEEWYQLLDIEEFGSRVKPIYEGEISHEVISRLTKESSSYYDGFREGVVIYDDSTPSFRMLKSYSPEFSEIDPSKPGLNKYLTWRRFVKAGQKIGELGNTLDLESMIDMVNLDVIKEAHLDKQDRPKLRELLAKKEYINLANTALDLF